MKSCQSVAERLLLLLLSLLLFLLLGMGGRQGQRGLLCWSEHSQKCFSHKYDNKVTLHVPRCTELALLHLYLCPTNFNSADRKIKTPDTSPGGTTFPDFYPWLEIFSYVSSKHFHEALVAMLEPEYRQSG